MIIFRYLCREVLSATFAVCVILLLILVSGRLVKYLAQVAASAMDPSIMIAMLGYRIPGFLELTLPLSFFLALLLCLGRMHVENEISVLYACGFSEKKLLFYTLLIASMLALAVGYLSLVVAPTGMAKVGIIAEAQRSRGEIDDLVAKKFYPLRGGKGVIYADQVSADRGLEEVFMVVTEPGTGSSMARVVMIVAQGGKQQRTEIAGEQYLVLNQGYRADGVPGEFRYQVTDFQEYGIRLADNRRYREATEVEAMPTRDLLNSADPKLQVALQWRLSIPLMMFVVTLMAWPLSRARPRQGRYSKLLPAVLLYLSYLVGLNALRGAMESGVVPASVTLFPLHLVFIGIGVALMFANPFARRITRRSPLPEANS